MSLQLNMVIRLVLEAGITMIGVREIFLLGVAATGAAGKGRITLLVGAGCDGATGAAGAFFG